MDPSMAIGFYIKNEEELNDFWKNAKQMNDQFAVFSVAEERPNYNDCSWADQTPSETGSFNDGDDEWEKVWKMTIKKIKLSF